MKFSLNEPQRAAVRYIDGPLLVLAGAGSGKTRVITAKIAHLIEQGVAPERIAAITFTNKAAREMRDRATALVPGAAATRGGTRANHRSAAPTMNPTICTFHALGSQDPAQRGASLGLSPRFSILDPGDIEPIVAELLATTDRARVRKTQWQISAWKNALIAPAQALAPPQTKPKAPLRGHTPDTTMRCAPIRRSTSTT